MSKVRVSGFTLSADGFGAAPGQSLENPFGVGGLVITKWLVQTRTFKQMIGQEGGTTGVDDDFASAAMRGVGAWILGRNMFTPSRGPWPNDEWKGWWGDTPPYHAPTFVLTHHARPPLEMKGGTTFHFVTGGKEEALQRAREAAGDLDIRIVGGVATVREYLQDGLIDELHLGITPAFLGNGEHLLGGIDTVKLGYRCTRHATSDDAMHVVLSKQA